MHITKDPATAARLFEVANSDEWTKRPMTTQFAPRPVGVDELRRAWHAVQAGEFRGTGASDSTRRRPPRPDSAHPRIVWTPPVGERVLVVVGCAGSCGATVLAVALASAAEGSARVVECAPATATGLAAACTAELGETSDGWVQGSRDQVRLQRAGIPRLLVDAIPAPPRAEQPMLTIVDVAHPIEEVLAGGGWLADLLGATPVVVLAARATVPGLRRLETCVDLVGAGRVVAAVLGPTRKRWPREVIGSLGPLTRAVIGAGRLVEIPEDRGLAVSGLTPAPLPSSLITVAVTLLPLTKGTPSDAA
jgi:hypothetical protein